MGEQHGATLERPATDCSICRRSVLLGEPLTPHHDPRAARTVAVCELCRERATERGWAPSGEPVRRHAGSRMRVEHLAPVRTSPGADGGEPLLAPQVGILERAIGLEAVEPDPAPPAALLERVRSQHLELEQLRRELDPVRRAEEQRRLERQAAEIRELRAQLRARDERIERLLHARHAETSPMRMSGHALHAFNQSPELERMARIARTLGDPVVHVRDEGPGIPRRVHLTLSWDIAWYQFLVKLDLAAGRASVHATDTGGDPASLPLEQRRPNARWSGSGLQLS